MPSKENQEEVLTDLYLEEVKKEVRGVKKDSDVRIYKICPRCNQKSEIVNLTREGKILKKEFECGHTIRSLCIF